jgi:hypothetical protein
MLVLSLAVVCARGEADGFRVERDHVIYRHFPDFTGMSVREKVDYVEAMTSAAREHPTGIMLCMPKIDAESVRQVQVSDFDGQDAFSENFGLRFKAITDFFDNENSITTSGSHLAAQSIRYAVSGDPAALAAARVAFRSLRIIYQQGVEQGVKGFMGKPYHFEFSSHTTGDQYLHMLWGLWSFYPVASAEEQAQISEMLVAAADYMISVDYTLYYEEGRSWNMREDPTDYNAIMAALVAAAYKMTGEEKYLEAYDFVMESCIWDTHRRLDKTIAEIKAGTWEVPPWEKLVRDRKRPGEFAHWEEIQHCQFVAIAATVIHESVPERFTQEQLSDVLAFWWEDWVTGLDQDYWGYLYWMLVQSEDRSWRPVERTERFPREEWFGGSPMLSFASQWIYGDCLARFQWTALVVAKNCPEQREEAVNFARTTLERMQPHHLLWIADPDGEQIPAGCQYFTEFLSSEVPENIIASYWEGVRLGYWE